MLSNSLSKTFYSVFACICFVALICLITIPEVTNAEVTFKPLANIPGITDQGEKVTLTDYISVLFILSISIGALLAVLKIALAGIKYMLSDIVTQKGQAKEDIAGALLGLGILLASVIILRLINEDLVNLDAFSTVRSSSSEVLSIPLAHIPSTKRVLSAGNSV